MSVKSVGQLIVAVTLTVSGWLALVTVNTYSTVAATTRLYVVDADGSGIKRVAGPDATGGAWSPDGSMIAYAFSKPRSLNDTIYTAKSNGSDRSKIPATKIRWARNTSWSATDKIAFSHGNSDGTDNLSTVKLDGTARKRLVKSSSSIGFFAWSPDGSKIAYTLCRDSCSLYVINEDGNGRKKLASMAQFNPVWSSDGEETAFSDQESINSESKTSSISAVKSNGFGKRQLIKLPKFAHPPNLVLVDTKPDFKEVAFAILRYSRGNALLGFDIYTMDSDGSGLKRAYKNRKGNHPQTMKLSPDGSKVIFDVVVTYDE